MSETQQHLHDSRPAAMRIASWVVSGLFVGLGSLAIGNGVWDALGHDFGGWAFVIVPLAALAVLAAYGFVIQRVANLGPAMWLVVIGGFVLLSMIATPMAAIVVICLTTLPTVCDRRSADLGVSIVIWIVLTFALLLIPVVQYFAPFVALAAAMTFRHLLKRLRLSYAITLLTYIEPAVTMNLPFNQVWAGVWQSECGWRRTRAKTFGELVMSQGRTIGEALAITMPHTPVAWTRVLHAAERIGRLKQVLPVLIHREVDQMNQKRSLIAERVVYVVLVLSVIVSIFTLLMIFIVPKFAAIGEDYNIAMPATFETLVQFSRWFAGSDGGGLAPGWAMVMPVALVGALVATLSTFTPSGRAMWNRIDWRLPILGRIRLDASYASAFEITSEALDAGWSLPKAIDAGIGATTHQEVRRRMTAWRDQLLEGRAIDDAAREARLPGALSRMIGSTHVTGRLAAVLAMFHRYHRHRVHRAATLLRESITPVLTMLMAIPVAWLAMGIVLMLRGLMYAVMFDIGWGAPW